ncbi:Tubulin-tyrosine ligase family protein [Tritrichomonas foetus]|uniref:Tubulin-tyrosine ligase family protein n=1 Tax=Tritrichomonas foetus TaxID=1144522 RepID=A0A1J4JKQ9_9EUKA|nr:Tubulin-tyrosine ligase family protein [Tritrichomonas foetus]|eukprot:OHS97836.1 Tubulin-tyrosine ligase family protein [Tritrichomonas foetus]
MKKLVVDVVENVFPSVFLAMDEIDAQILPGSDTAILVWRDSIHTREFFHNLKPWQTVNRIPMIETLCHKAFFIHGIQRLQKFFPETYHFIPQSYILPILDSYFAAEIKRTKKTYIVKPDSGSFGRGIEIINPGDEYKTPKFLAIAQEYIESYLIDNTKFDLRVYVLLSSIDPLEIFVYRDGVARFCSAKSGTDSKFSKLTNVELNKKNPDVEISQISKLISDVFSTMKSKGIDVDEIWSKIDEAVVLCIISCYGDILKAVQQSCPKISVYSRCFQLLGFDVLLDQNLKPWVLEVNYRPSLMFYRPQERRMKVKMLSELIRIACPLSSLQGAFLARKKEWYGLSFMSLISNEPGIIEAIARSKAKAVENSKFVKVYPTNNPHQRKWNEVMKKQMELPPENIFQLSKPLMEAMCGQNPP